MYGIKIFELITIVFLSIYFLIYFFILNIHIRQKVFRECYFSIVFIEVFLEILLVILLITLVILRILDLNPDNWNFVLAIIFNFLYITIIAYHISSMFYFKNHKTTEEMISGDYDEVKGHQYSVSFQKHSYTKMHIISLLFGVLHTVGFAIICHIKNKEGDNQNKYLFNNNIENQNSIFIAYNWFIYFIKLNAELYYLLIFFPFLIYLIISLVYLKVSWNKEELTEYVHLKRYAINCTIGSLCSIGFIIVRIVGYFYYNEEDKLKILEYFMSIVFLIYLGYNCYFRMNSYYMQKTLISEGKASCVKLKLFFKILFFVSSVPNPDFVDYDNTYIYHSLANLGDFVGVEKESSAYRDDPEMIDRSNDGKITQHDDNLISF